MPFNFIMCHAASVLAKKVLTYVQYAPVFLARDPCLTHYGHIGKQVCPLLVTCANSPSLKGWQTQSDGVVKPFGYIIKLVYGRVFTQLVLVGVLSFFLLCFSGYVFAATDNETVSTLQGIEPVKDFSV